LLLNRLMKIQEHFYYYIYYYILTAVAYIIPHINDNNRKIEVYWP
jgi:hypothetical protein